MKLITCVGYTNSGSSAINNILMEFEDCCALTPYNECRFLQDPDGIADLEYNLFDNRQRLNSEYAIKRYKIYTTKYDRRNFTQIFGKNWINYNQEFIKSITQFSYNSYWHADIINFNIFYKVKHYSIRLYRNLMNKLFKVSKEDVANHFPSLEMRLPIDSRDIFLKNTRQFCEKLFNSLNKEEKKFGIVDQLVPPRNVGRYLRYLDNLKVIIVDRDPRDIYIDSMLKNDRAFPKNVEKFCKIYKDSRAGKNTEENILEIRFEDLIYNFEKTFKVLVEFIGIDINSRKTPGKFFSLEKSKENTKLWEKHKKFSKEVAYIEKELIDYLYY